MGERCERQSEIIKEIKRDCPWISEIKFMKRIWTSCKYQFVLGIQEYPFSPVICCLRHTNWLFFQRKIMCRCHLASYLWTGGFCMCQVTKICSNVQINGMNSDSKVIVHCWLEIVVQMTKICSDVQINKNMCHYWNDV